MGNRQVVFFGMNRFIYSWSESFPLSGKAWLRGAAMLAGAVAACVVLAGCGNSVATPVVATITVADGDTTGFPADSGILNVRDFGAKGDGATDDTAAILQAVAASGTDLGSFFWQNKIVYFPNGTYLISAPITKKYVSGGFASGMMLIGQSEAGTTLKLKDNAAGFQSPAAQKGMIFMSSKLLDGSPTSGGKDYTNLGEGNDAYQNSIQNMTINAGVGNAGAMGIDYLASNLGWIRHVTVTAPLGSGATGIAMTRKWIGPALLEHVTVNGFSVGIDVANTEYGVTMNHLVLTGQLTAGLRNSQNSVSVNDLEANTFGPAIVSTAADGLIVLAQSQLNSSSSTTVTNTLGTIVFHGSRANNYMKFTTVAQTGDVLDGYLTGPAAWTPKNSARFIPVEDPPTVPADPLSAWLSPTKFGTVPVANTDKNGNPVTTPTDSLPAFQQAFATGASTIYLPHGLYYISSNLEIPATVKRIVGMASTIRVYQGDGYHMNRQQGMFRLLEGTDPLQIENLTFDNSNYGTQWALEHIADRPLVVYDGSFTGTIMLNRAAAGGKDFLNDVTCAGCVANTVAGPATLTAVQLDMENCKTCLINNGATVNILGVKTEGIVTVVSATGGNTQVLGGLVYMVVSNTSPVTPIFASSGGVLTASVLEEAFASNTHFINVLSDTENGSTTLTPEAGYPVRDPGNFGRIFPWVETAP